MRRREVITMLAMMTAGVAAGANSPNQEMTSKSGKPDSASVGLRHPRAVSGSILSASPVLATMIVRHIRLGWNPLNGSVRYQQRNIRFI